MSPFPSLDYIAVSVDGNIFKFESVLDYENMLLYLDHIEKDDIVRFEQWIGIETLAGNCLRENQEAPINDLAILLILNKESKVSIGNYQFYLDFENLFCEVQEYNEGQKKSTPKRYDWDVAVLDVVFNDAKPVSTKGTMFSPSPSNSLSNTVYVSNCTVTAEVFYNNIPLAYRLKAKIDESPSRAGIDTWVGVGWYTASNTMTYVQAKTSCSEYSDYDEGSGGSVVVIYSSGTKRLDGYYAWADFTVYDNYVAPTAWEDFVIYISNDVSSIVCD